MKPFIHDDFLLHNETAKLLFHQHAKKMPIIDYHCHLLPNEIAENITFKNITEAWLKGDHYKWRLMRANGIDESYITGNKTDEEKFLKWAETVPLLIGNPLYHWTHLELKQFFNIEETLNEANAMRIYDRANQKLKSLSALDMIKQSNVEIICTTDDPVDSLSDHTKIKNNHDIDVLVYPTFRPDKAVNIELDWFNDWIDSLAKVTDSTINHLIELKAALVKRIEFFHDHGTRISDHALDVVTYEEAKIEEVETIFTRARNKEKLSAKEVAQYKTHLLIFLGTMYHQYGWTQQYHMGALRNVSTKQLAELGPDSGYDAINDRTFAIPLQRLLDALDSRNALPKTILYTLNPRDFEVAITIMQAFQDGQIPGKIQFGSAWWFLDTIDGMEKQLRALANNGLLARFVGMLTDSRSFLSYSRHDYFRRILCNFIGEQVEKGYYPYDLKRLGKIVEDIAYNNSKNYFNFE